jgi:hypothetical protein
MRLIVLLLILYGVYTYFGGGSSGGVSSSSHEATLPAPQADQSQVMNEPYQRNLSGLTGVDYGIGKLKFLAEYQITARVMSKQYYTADYNARIAPVDLALGWGRMSDPAIYEQLSITQSGRFYKYRWSSAPPIPQQEIVNSSANVHIVPANAAVKSAINALDEGQIATLKGYLVFYREEEGDRWWEWKSSMVRTDTGHGACELFYVEHVIGY